MSFDTLFYLFRKIGIADIFSLFIFCRHETRENGFVHKFTLITSLMIIYQTGTLSHHCLYYYYQYYYYYITTTTTTTTTATTTTNNNNMMMMI